MRVFPLAALLSVAMTGTALADAAIAGRWQSDMGKNVVMDMRIAQDGKWSSETHQGNNVVAQMAGTYRQTPRTPTSGRVVFVPTHSETSAAHGAAKRETDQYVLAENGQELRLTSGGDTMVFHKTAP